jgi:CubicO group peptidase (beta-lactamase class C family)
MHRLTIAMALAACLIYTSQAHSQQPASDPTVAALTQDVPHLMQEADIPGLSIALLRNGNIAWAHSFGTVNPSTNQPVTDHTRFSAASLSKTVFAYAVLKLVEQGKLDLDTPLSHYWSERIVDPANDPRLDKITARLVLSHRTGFPNWRPDGGQLKIFFNPGERFSYSGEGYVYLQHTVEHIEGKPLNDIMQQLVFTPLGMNDSSYILQPDWAANISPGYTVTDTAIPPHQGKEANAAASLLTTAHDYALFLQAILNGRGLKPETLRQMETPQIAVDPTCTNCTDHAPAKLSTNLFWGLGWGIEQTATGKYLWHWGDNNVYKAFVAVDLNRRDAVVYFSNSVNGLSIAPALVHEAIGGDHPSLTWLHYDTYDSPAMRFSRDIVRNGSQALTTHSTQLKDGTISEDSINSAGYLLLEQKKYADAIAVFTRNTELHPQSANTWDSLGEAYVNAGQKDQAIQSYEKALQLNPNQESSKTALAKLHSEPTETTAAH